MFVSVLPLNIAPTISWTCSVVSWVLSATKSIVPSESWYVAVMFVSVLPLNIAPTISWICSSVFPPSVTVAIPEDAVAVRPDWTKFINVTPVPIVTPPDWIPTLDNLSFALSANFASVTDASAGTDTPIDVPRTII